MVWIPKTLIISCELQNIIVSDNTNHQGDHALDEDSDGYVNPNPIPVEQDETGYMRVDKQLELAEDGHGYLKPISNQEASGLIEEASYSEIKSQDEKPYINCKFVDA